LSSAILYVAIVAIWACVLVPRWLHRSHDNHSGQDADSGQDDFAEGAGPAGFSEEPGADPLAWEDPGVVPPGPVAPDEAAVHAEYSSVSYSMTTVSVETGAYDESGADPQPENSPPAHAGPVRPHPRGSFVPHPGGSSRPQDRPASRARVLQARRRLLTMLAVLTIGTAACAATGLMPWWVLIVPVGLVCLYLLLLREAARVDAENARRHAEAHARYVRTAARARVLRERARQAQAVPAPEPNAEVIDISALAAPAGDQLYDQYADAEIRAVGD